MSDTIDHNAPGLRRVTNDIKAGGADALSIKVMDLMNECTKEHDSFTAHYGVLYAAGAALACAGAALDERVDLRQQLAPLFSGYADSRAEQPQTH